MTLLGHFSDEKSEASQSHGVCGPRQGQDLNSVDTSIGLYGQGKVFRLLPGWRGWFPRLSVSIS